MEHTAEILHTGFVTHDVMQFITTRPPGLRFRPGQGVEIALDRDDWRDQGRPFTPTGNPEGPVLEFTIKGYFGQDGVTERLHRSVPGTPLLMSDSFGTITDRGAGTFIAGGAGVTPFLAILRHRKRRDDLQGCALLFSNKTPADVICEKELRNMLGERCHLTCTKESSASYEHRRIDRGYLEEKIDDPDRPFYVCGPPTFVEDICEALRALGVNEDQIVIEE